MRKYLLLFAVLFCSYLAQAGHVAGAHIEYKNLGNQKYEITLTIYRDCNGAAAFTNPLVARCSAGTQNLSLTLVSTTDVTEIAPNCSTTSLCGSTSFAYGIEKRVYNTVADFSSLSCCQVTLSWDQCCRSANISTGASGSNFYTEAMVDKCEGSTFAWADFTPQFLLQKGSDYILNFSATDSTDKDSIVYQMVGPLVASATAVSYSGSFSATKPLTFQGFPNANLSPPSGFRFDAARGNMYFRPTKQNEMAPIIVEATEWRFTGGVPKIVGKSRKEHIVSVVDLGSLSGTNATPFQLSPEVFFACAGDTSYAVIDIVDGNQNDTINFNFKHNLMWATAQQVSARKILVTYVVDTVPLLGIANAFTLEVRDNACPVYGHTIKTYGLLPGGLKFSDNSFISKKYNCGRVKFKVNNRLGSGFSYTWNFNVMNKTSYAATDSVDIQVTDTGWVKAELWVTSPAHCNYYKYTDSIFVHSLEAVQVDAGPDTTTCGSAPLILTATAVLGKAPYSFSWSNGDTAATAIVLPPKKVSSLIVNMTDDNGCTTADTLQITNYHPVITVAGNEIVCENDSIHLTASFVDGVSPKFGWVGLPPGGFKLNDKIAVATQYTFRVSDGPCFFSKQHTVAISQPALSYSHDTTWCKGDTMLLSANPSGGRAPYSIFWDTYLQTGQNIQVNTDFLATGYALFTTSVTDSLGCTGAASGKVFINPLPVVTIQPLPPLCVNGNTLSLDAVTTPTGGTWTGTGVSGSDFSPATAMAGLHQLHYFYTDTTTGCSKSAQVHQRVLNPPVVNFTADSTTVIKGSTLQFTNTTTADTSFTSKWVFGLPQTPANTKTNTNPTYTFADTGYYTVKLVVADGVCGADSVTRINYIYVYAPKPPDNIGVNEVVSIPFSVYPNPASGIVKVQAGGNETVKQLQLMGISGKEIFAAPAGQTHIDVANLETGVYFIKITTSQNISYYSKIIVE